MNNSNNIDVDKYSNIDKKIEMEIFDCTGCFISSAY